MVAKSIYNKQLVVRALLYMVTVRKGRGWLRSSLAASFLIAANNLTVTKIGAAMGKISDYQKRLNTLLKVVFTIIGLSVMSGISQGPYPAATKSIVTILAIIFLLWTWGVPLNKRAK